MRIVSLLPSATEIVAILGLGEQLVGVTHECDYPDFVKRLPKVTKTLIPHDASSAEIDRLVREQLREQKALYLLDEEMLARVRPDLIVTQDLCDVCAVAQEDVQAAVCKLPGRPTVLNLEPTTLHEVFDSIQLVADFCKIANRGRDIVHWLKGRIATIRDSVPVGPRPRAVLLEWLDPPFSCGHWTPELVRLAGATEVLGREGERSRTLSWEEIAEADPDVVFVACCGFNEARAAHDVRLLASNPLWASLRAVREGQVHIFDGNQFFNRPGPRLVESVELLAAALTHWDARTKRGT